MICRILPICFPNLSPGCSTADYIPECCHILGGSVAKRNFGREAGRAARLISVLKADVLATHPLSQGQNIRPKSSGTCPGLPIPGKPLSHALCGLYTSAGLQMSRSRL